MLCVNKSYEFKTKKKAFNSVEVKIIVYIKSNEELDSILQRLNISTPFKDLLFADHWS